MQHVLVELCVQADKARSNVERRRVHMSECVNIPQPGGTALDRCAEQSEGGRISYTIERQLCWEALHLSP
jgi:hypothetical protein